MEAARESLNLISQLRKGMASYAPGENWDISAPAAVAAQAILKHFTIAKSSRMEATEKNLARLIDVSTDVFRAQRAMDIALALPWHDKNELHRQLRHLRNSIRDMDIVRARLPEVAKSHGRVQRAFHREPRLVRSQVSELKQAAKAIGAARSPREEQALVQEVHRQGLLVER